MRDRWAAIVRYVRRPAWDRILVPVFLFAFVVARSGQFEERDPYWQTRAGMENLAGWPLARPDTWTWAGPDGLWYQSSPLWNTALGAGYALAGFWGIFALTVALLGAFFAISYLLALRLGGRRLPALAGLLLASSPALSMLSPRGTLVVEVLILGSVLIAVEWVRRFATTGRTWVHGVAALACAAALSTLGNWLHLSFLVFGPAMALVWAVVWWFSPMPVARRIVVILAGGLGWLVGPVLSPYGLAGGLARTRAVQEACEGLILEWTSPWQVDISRIFWLMGAAGALLAVAVTVWLVRRALSRRWGTHEAGLAAMAVIGVPAAVAGMGAIRFLGVALLTLAPVVAVGATAVVDALRHRWPPQPGTRWADYSSGGFWRVVTSASLVLVVPFAAYLGSLHSVPSEAEAIRALPQDCRLFTSGALAAPTILIRPDVLVWMDGRADFFGRDRIIEAYQVFALEAPRLVPDGATCVLMDAKSRDSQLIVPAIDASPDWRAAQSFGRFRIWLPAR